MKALGGRNLILPKLQDFENMGLRRSRNYHCLTYAQLLERLQITEDPFGNAVTDHAKKVRDYAHTEFFIVPDGLQQQDEKPIHAAAGESRSINLGSEGLLENFAQFLYPGLNWEVPQDGSVRPHIAALNSLPEDPGDGYVEKVMQWINRFGLLFNEPVPETLIENIYNAHHLPYSDAVYRGVCAEYSNVPYFLSVKAFCELNRYALKILFVAWLYSKDPEIRKIAEPDLTLGGKPGSDKKVSSEETIMEGYALLDPNNSKSLEEVAKAMLGDEHAQATRYYRNRQYALRGLSKHMLVWIHLEMTVQLNPIAEGANTARYVLPLGEDKGEWATEPRYQCTNIFSCMMLEALSLLNKSTRYRTCPVCGKVFDIGKGRSDRVYCSDGSVLSYENCKAMDRYRRERVARHEKKEKAKEIKETTKEVKG